MRRPSMRVLGWTLFVVSTASLAACAVGSDDNLGPSGDRDGDATGGAGGGGAAGAGGTAGSAGDGGAGGSAGKGGSGGGAGTDGGGVKEGGAGKDGGGGSDGGGQGGSGGAAGGGGSGGAGGGTSCASTSACASATALAQLSGDKGAGVDSASGSTSQWFSVRVTEDDSSVSPKKLHVTATLLSPAASNYDLYLYVNGGSDIVECSTESGSSTKPAGQSDTVAISWGEGGVFSNGSDDGRTVSIEVRHVTGPCDAAASWSLSVLGNQ